MAKRTVNMTSGSPAKHILRFALPLILTNMGQQLYMITDSAIVGRGVGVKALAAVGSTDWCYALYPAPLFLLPQETAFSVIICKSS